MCESHIILSITSLYDKLKKACSVCCVHMVRQFHCITFYCPLFCISSETLCLFYEPVSKEEKANNKKRELASLAGK